MNLKNRVVVRFKDGRMLKGFTWDFTPNKEIFHLADAADERKVTEVATKDLKAVFFVRTFEGDPNHKAAYTLDSLRKIGGVKLKVSFQDGEVLYGAANAYAPGRKGFFLMPADPTGNNERVFIVTDFASSVEPFQGEPEPAKAKAEV